MNRVTQRHRVAAFWRTPWRASAIRTMPDVPFPTTVEFAKGKLWVTSIPGFADGDPTGVLVTVTP